MLHEIQVKPHGIVYRDKVNYHEGGSRPLSVFFFFDYYMWGFYLA